MIEFLKESTFAVNEVISKAWVITKRNYISIIFLSILMFGSLGLSSLFSFFLKDVNPILNILMFLLFIAFYLTFNLSLFKYIFYLLDHEVDNVRIVDTFPSKEQIVKFLLSSLYITLSNLMLFALTAIIAIPFLYLGVNYKALFDVTVFIATFLTFVTQLRLSFFPFFIIDRNENSISSLKFSLAITKGNFTKILILLFFLKSYEFLYIFLNYKSLYLTATFVNFFGSFIIVPLSAVALTIAYRQMIDEYKGDQDPEILKNII